MDPMGYTACLIGILLVIYENPHKTGDCIIPYIKQPHLGCTKKITPTQMAEKKHQGEVTKPPGST